MAEQLKKVRKATEPVAGAVQKAANQTSGGDIGQSVRQLVGVATKRLATSVSGKVGQLTTYAANGGKAVAAATGARADTDQDDSDKDDDGGGDRFKVTSLIEQIDIGAPAELVYDEWTRFEDFPALWSHRTDEAELIEEAPHDRMVWTSEGGSEHVDAAVTFHELAPDLTRIVLVLEYHPRSVIERAGNLWRARERAARHELKNFQRHVMTHAVLHSEEDEPPPERPRSRTSRGAGTTKNKPTSNRRSRA